MKRYPEKRGSEEKQHKETERWRGKIKSPQFTQGSVEEIRIMSKEILRKIVTEKL